MNPGLHYHLYAKRQLLVKAEATSLDPDSGAAATHNAVVSSAILSREIADLEEQIGQDVDMEEAIGQFINFLQASKHKTRLRSLTLTDLEQAQDRLRRELGDKPE